MQKTNIMPVILPVFSQFAYKILPKSQFFHKNLKICLNSIFPVVWELTTPLIDLVNGLDDTKKQHFLEIVQPYVLYFSINNNRINFYRDMFEVFNIKLDYLTEMMFNAIKSTQDTSDYELCDRIPELQKIQCSEKNIQLYSIIELLKIPFTTLELQELIVRFKFANFAVYSTQFNDIIVYTASDTSVTGNNNIVFVFENTANWNSYRQTILMTS